MPSYRVLLRGQNVWMRIEGKPRRMGFFTTRFVEASDAERAGPVAVAALRDEERLKPLNEAGDPPEVFCDEVEEVSPADVADGGRGLAFFPDDRELDS
jgi:hypothetical protein